MNTGLMNRLGLQEGGTSANISDYMHKAYNSFTLRVRDSRATNPAVETTGSSATSIFMFRGFQAEKGNAIAG